MRGHGEVESRQCRGMSTDDGWGRGLKNFRGFFSKMSRYEDSRGFFGRVSGGNLETLVNDLLPLINPSPLILPDLWNTPNFEGISRLKSQDHAHSDCEPECHEAFNNTRGMNEIIHGKPSQDRRCVGCCEAFLRHWYW